MAAFQADVQGALPLMLDQFPMLRELEQQSIRLLSGQVRVRVPVGALFHQVAIQSKIDLERKSCGHFASRARAAEQRPFKPQSQGASPWRCTIYWFAGR